MKSAGAGGGSAISGSRPRLRGWARLVWRLLPKRRVGRVFAQVCDLIPVGLGLFDHEDVLQYANRALCRMLGSPARSLAGRPAVELFAAEQCSGPLAEMDTGQHRVLAARGGGLVHCQAHASPLLREDGTAWRVVVFDEVTDRVRETEYLRYQSRHDELTGLLNRAGLREALDALIAEHAAVGVCFCDVDDFKRINDAWGHEAGDQLLIGVARRLQTQLDASCRIGRFSGDEFVVLAPDVDATGGLQTLAEEVADCLDANLLAGHEWVQISGAVGAAAINGAAATGDELLRFADVAMFTAKHRGRGQIAYADTSLHAARTSRMNLEEPLRRALSHDELALHYQPIADRSGRPALAEALVRWPHPEHGTLAPAVILPVAAHGDLLGELDRWVLRTATAEATHWPAAIAVAVNLTGLLPHTPGFVDEVTTVLAGTGLDPARLVLEITETVATEAPDTAHQAMRALTESGVRFALDDFGTGHSSLTRLNELPTQILKLDHAFVPRGHNADRAIAQAVVDLAHGLGHVCVAEGVETADEHQLLTELGCDYYQGWHLGYPQPSPDIRVYLD